MGDGAYVDPSDVILNRGLNFAGPWGGYGQGFGPYASQSTIQHGLENNRYFAAADEACTRTTVRDANALNIELDKANRNATGQAILLAQMNDLARDSARCCCETKLGIAALGKEIEGVKATVIEQNQQTTIENLRAQLNTCLNQQNTNQILAAIQANACRFPVFPAQQGGGSATCNQGQVQGQD